MRSAEDAYQQAGITDPRAELAMAEVHDCFTPTELVLMEDLGFAERGFAWKEVLAGTFDLDGELPVNPDGGLKSFGHPIGASGLRMLFEGWPQLRGEAGERQISSIPAGKRKAPDPQPRRRPGAASASSPSSATSPTPERRPARDRVCARATRTRLLRSSSEILRRALWRVERAGTTPLDRDAVRRVLRRATDDVDRPVQFPTSVASTPRRSSPPRPRSGIPEDAVRRAIADRAARPAAADAPAPPARRRPP